MPEPLGRCRPAGDSIWLSAPEEKRWGVSFHPFWIYGIVENELHCILFWRSLHTHPSQSTIPLRGRRQREQQHQIRNPKQSAAALSGSLESVLVCTPSSKQSRGQASRNVHEESEAVVLIIYAKESFFYVPDWPGHRWDTATWTAAFLSAHWQRCLATLIAVHLLSSLESLGRKPWSHEPSHREQLIFYSCMCHSFWLFWQFILHKIKKNTYLFLDNISARKQTLWKTKFKKPLK